MTMISSQPVAARVLWYGLSVLVLTSVHHAYGAYIYDTPWRLHVLFLAGPAAAAIGGAFLVLRRPLAGVTRQIAFWLFVAVTLVIPIAIIGLIEGGYNHAVKNALYFGGASPAAMHRRFPPPTYELPNDVLFEVTGVLQAVLAIGAGYHLGRLVRHRLRNDSAREVHS